MDTISVNEKLSPGTDLDHVPPVDILPKPVPILFKYWEPSRRYVEVSKGEGLDYQEMVVPYDDVKEFIKNGWSITRLSKLSQNYVNIKWMNAIIAMEQQKV